MPGLFGIRFWLLDFSESKPPTNPSIVLIVSSPGKKQRRTRPLGAYIITSRRAGAGLLFTTLPKAEERECKKGSAIVAPFSFRKLRLDVIIFMQTSEVDES